MAWFRARAVEPFDLANEVPVRVFAANLANGQQAIAIIMHHLVTDGSSAPLFYRDLSDAYRARRQGLSPDFSELEFGYYDWAMWQRGWRESEDFRVALDQVCKRLNGAPDDLNLPEDFARSDMGTFSGSMLLTAVPVDVSRALKIRARDAGATLFMTLAAGLAVFLGRVSGQDDIIIGTPISGRDRAETEALVGYLVNTIPLRLCPKPSFALDEFLKKTQDEVLAAFSSSGVPLDKVVQAVQPERIRSRTPLFRVLIVLQPIGNIALELEGASLKQVNIDAVSARYDLVFAFDDYDGSLELVLHYANDLFLPETAQMMVRGLLQVLRSVADDRECLIGDLDIIDSSERLAETSGPRVVHPTPAPDGSVVSTFRGIAERHSDLAAIEGVDGSSLDYAGLDEVSDRIAGGLVARGVRRGDRVGLHMSRGSEQIAAMLAVMKAGSAYVPLDPDQPVARLSDMIADASPHVVVTNLPEDERLPDTVTFAELASSSDRPPVVDLTGADAAYVMFTSGSTGRPKGIVVPHRAILRLAIEPGFANFGPGKRVAQIATTAFDAATYEIWCALLNGATTVVIDRMAAFEPKALAEAFQSARIHSTFLTATVFNRAAFSQEDVFSGFQEVLFGGEAADVAAVRLARERWPSVRFVNGYGPTETTTFASFHEVTSVPAGARTVPIGCPIRATALYVLDENLSPVPRGVAGELYIGGEGLAHGYHGDPSRTATSFIADPFSQHVGARMYATGDRVRRRPDGAVEYLGRMDRQIKLRGFRIEPGEIEAAIKACLGGTVDAVVDARRDVRDDGMDDHALYAWVIGRTLDATEERSLRQELASQLPEWMMPRRIFGLEEPPLTPNGKLDHAALTVVRSDDDEADVLTEGFATATEEALAHIWSELLDGVAITRNDSFFSIGGHSLLGVRLVARIRTRFGVTLDLRQVFEKPNLGEMASAVDSLIEKGATAEPAIKRRVRRGGRDRKQAEQ